MSEVGGGTNINSRQAPSSTQYKS